MPKEIVNNRINYCDIGGRVIQHDVWLDQSLLRSSSPTFSNLQVTGDTTIEGNLYVEGNTVILNTNIVEFEDNIILLNKQETGNGITLNQGGIEIERGILENFRFVYDETFGNFRVGPITNLEPVAIREDVPLLNGVMIWNNTNKRLESRNVIDIPMRFSSTQNVTSSTSASVVFNGSLGVQKDIYIDNRIHFVGTSNLIKSVLYTDTASNSFTIQSPQSINLLPFVNVSIPYNKSLIFGSTSQGIVANNITNNLTISAQGDINLTAPRIVIPNQTPIVLSTQNEKIYTDGSNNIVIETSQNILLKPANGNGNKSVQIPVNTPITFSNSSQQITANTLGELLINAGNNILLTPGANLNVKIPIDNGIEFGEVSRISTNTSNNLYITSSADIFLSATDNINIPDNVPLTFSDYSQSITADTNGTLFVDALKELNVKSILHLSNTLNATNVTTASLIIDGGLSIKKDIISESSILIKSQNTNAFVVNNTSNDTFSVNTDLSGKISILAGDGTMSNPSLEISSNTINAKSLIKLMTQIDTTLGYQIGRPDRRMTMNLPSYTQYNNLGDRPKFSITSYDTNIDLFSIESETGDIYSLGSFSLSNTKDATSSTDAAVVISGGLGVVKSFYTTGKIINSVDSTTALQIQNANKQNVFNIDTINNQVTFRDTSGNIGITIDNTARLLTSNYINYFTNTTESIDTSSGNTIFNGGVAIQKALNVNNYSTFNNGINMNNSRIRNLMDPDLPQDSATKAYVDLVKQGLYVKDAVKVATTVPLNLSTDFIAGNNVDNYTLIIGDRILIKNQTDPIENGIYNITNGIPTRTIDNQLSYNASGIFVFVQNGDVNKYLGWICISTPNLDVVGTDPLNFTQFTGLGQVTPGIALSKVFNTLNVNVDNVSLEINSNIIRVSNLGISTGLTGGSGSPLQTITDQSHVTKLGTINTGVWQGSTVVVTYGGTGRNILQQGNILFGDTVNPVGLDNKFYYDTLNTRLGLGTNVPTKDFQITNSSTATILIDSDTNGINNLANPEIILKYAGSNTSTITMTRNINQYVTGALPGALLVSNDQTNDNSIIQLATNKITRITVVSSGNVGINNTNPSTTLDLNGTLNATGLITFTNTLDSINSSIASVVFSGGLSINSTQNSTNASIGGGLTIKGGSSIEKDLYVGKNIYITSTFESINSSSGSLFVDGGITIKCSTDSSSITNGGSLLIKGGASIGKKLYVGDTLTSEKDTFLGNMYFTSTPNENYIQSSQSKISDSFNPIHITKYNNTTSSIITIDNNSIILENNTFLKIGGSLTNSDGYYINYTDSNLNIVPNTNGLNINIGTLGSFSDLNIYGSNSSITFTSTSSNLKITGVTTQLVNSIITGSSILLTSPNTSGSSFIQSKDGNMTLNLGSGSSGGQLTTILSNALGTSKITFIPSTSSSTLTLDDNVISQFNGQVSLLNNVVFSGNALHQTLINTSGSLSNWIYFGKISNGNDNGYTEIDFIDGRNVNSITSTSGLKLQVSINGTNTSFSHQHYGNLLYNSSDKVKSFVYKAADDSFNLFCLLPPNSKTNVNVTTQYNTQFILLSEGYSTTPNGINSGYTGSWTLQYKTDIESNLKNTFGDTVVEGLNLKIADNLPIIGYNNSLVNQSKNLGILFQRYQKDNDTSLGDIINDTRIFTDIIVSQLTIPINQIKFSVSASSIDNEYNGYWLKVVDGTNVDQVRQIITYNGTLRVATLSSPFTTQNPTLGDTINLYNNSFVANYYDQVDNTFSLSFTSIKNDNLINNQNANLRLDHLKLTDTTPSLNSSSGSIYTLGGISINNTNDAISSTQGMTFTTLGGIAIRKNMLIGNNLGLGTTGFIPQESIHIKKTIGDNNVNASIRLENDSSESSYIDFVENTSGNRYGITNTNAIFSLTNTTIGVIPPLANKALTINNLGYIGINTTQNITSPLTINASNFISTNSSVGFLGLIGGSSNLNDNSLASRIILNSNSGTTQGSLNLYSGNSSGVNIFTGNDILAQSIDQNGITKFYSTENSTSDTSGAVIISGGLCILSSQNSSSLINGGSLTINGGASLKKDLYIGGNIYVTGSVVAAGNVISPTISFNNTENCSFNEYYNNNLTSISNMGILTFAFSVIPSQSSLNTQIEFTLPGKINTLTKRGDITISVSGYTDDTNVIPLFNIIGVGIVGTTRGLIKFQSVSTSIHYFQVNCQYILS